RGRRERGWGERDVREVSDETAVTERGVRGPRRPGCERREPGEGERPDHRGMLPRVGVRCRARRRGWSSWERLTSAARGPDSKSLAWQGYARYHASHGTWLATPDGVASRCAGSLPVGRDERGAGVWL